MRTDTPNDTTTPSRADLPESDKWDLQHLFADIGKWQEDFRWVEQTGAEIVEWLARRGSRPLFFYDIDTPITLVNLAHTRATDYLRADQVPVCVDDRLEVVEIEDRERDGPAARHEIDQAAVEDPATSPWALITFLP